MFNKKKHIIVFGEALTQGLDDTIFTAEKKYSINFLLKIIKNFV